MKLDNYYTVSSDGQSWTLTYEEERGISEKTGKPVIKTKQWFHTRLRDSIASYIDKKLMDKETVDEAVTELKELLDKAYSLDIK